MDISNFNTSNLTPGDEATLIRAHPSMSIDTAAALHRRAYGFKDVLSIYHEVPHLLLVLLDVPEPQGNYTAESFVTAMQSSLRAAAEGRENPWALKPFTSNVQREAESFLADENLMRTLCYLLAPAYNTTPTGVRRIANYDDAILTVMANSHDILVNDLSNTGAGSFSWQVETPGGAIYFFDSAKYKGTLPAAVIPAAAPSAGTCAAMFDRLTPAMTALCEFTQNSMPQFDGSDQQTNMRLHLAQQPVSLLLDNLVFGPHRPAPPCAPHPNATLI